MNVRHIIVIYEDATFKEAVGDDAKAIWEWWTRCEALMFSQGGLYDGPKLRNYFFE